MILPPDEVMVKHSKNLSNFHQKPWKLIKKLHYQQYGHNLEKNEESRRCFYSSISAGCQHEQLALILVHFSLFLQAVIFQVPVVMNSCRRPQWRQIHRVLCFFNGQQLQKKRTLRGRHSFQKAFTAKATRKEIN